MDKESILAVIVTYNPNFSVLEKNINKLYEQIKNILVVDNSDISEIKQYIFSYCKERKLYLIQNKQNEGIAKALNQGLEFAQVHHFHWVLTLDQDSQVCDHYIDGIIKDYNNCREKDNVAIVFPQYLDEKSLLPYKTNNRDLLDTKIVITSGNILNINKAFEVGKFNEKLFIDEVDHDLCLRLVHKGYKLLESKSSCLLHNLGNSSTHKILFFELKTSNYNYIRRYFITRNNIYIAKKYFWKETKLITKKISFLIRDTIKVILFEKDKFRKFISIMRGIKDGLLNRMGPYRY